jgi:hypothetical protein
LSTSTVVDGASLPWVNGMDVYASMEPAFRENLGDPNRVEELFSKYWLKQLWIDDSSRRIDHVRVDPGYIDLCEAYHDSVEEAYFLGGETLLTAEGRFEAGDYFWRPPGWVHMAAAPQGFETIIMMEGDDPTEGSGRVSRVVRGDDEAGHNPRPGDDGGLGPRGYVRRAESRFMPWRAHDDAATGLGDGLTSKVLSLNEVTGARSVLVRLPDGWEAPLRGVARDRFIVSTEGTMAVDGTEVATCSLVHVPAGADGPTLAARGDVDLLVKVGPEK